jgi:hypothetical protein
MGQNATESDFAGPELGVILTYVGYLPGAKLCCGLKFLTIFLHG